ncbi:MAG: nitroreductase family protein [Faecalibacterium sp.]
MNEIFTRRSVRQFSDAAVSPEQTEQLLRAAMQSPSAHNQQPWQFLVVRGKENLTRLASCNPYASFLPSANLAIVLLADKARMIHTEAYWQQDLGAATQTLLLEAAALGLGAVWLGTASEPARMDFIQKEYALGEHLVPFSVVAIGHPKETDANHFVDRYDASRVRYIGE